ncbi:MAG TPA: Zn-ribbon domain-containing OB-fold protein [Stellaceae bacterium]
MAERKITAPAINPETKHFWDAAATGQLLMKKCLACGELHYYPRSICPFCHSDRTEWLAASGKGTIYSYSVMRRVPEPFAIAYVTLEEGPRMLTNLVDCSLDDLKIGKPVTLVWKPSDNGPNVPMFTLA